MPESFVGVAPDSTGKKLRTRQRTVGATTVDESYVILQNERIVSARAYVMTFRTISRAVTAQPIFTLWNGGTNLVAVRRLTLEADHSPPTTANATLQSPYARLFRMTTAPTGGLALAKIQQDSNETTSAAVVATGDAASDNTVAATALAFTPNPTAALWGQNLPRFNTSSGWAAPPVMNMLPDDAELNREDPVILRPNQGVGVRVDAVANMVLNTGGTAAGGYSFFVKCAFGEFTLP